MQNVFDITAYGALGDGRTDCTAAVQNALDAAAAGGGKVVVPPGTYMVGRLKMSGKGVSLEGTPAWSFRSNGASVFKLNTAAVDCMLDITGAFGCSIRGLSMDGGNLGEGVHGIKLYWDKYNGGAEEDTPSIDDCRIGRFSGDGLHFEHVWCFSVRHSMLCGNQGAGLYIDGWDAFILDNWFSGNKNGGLLGGPCVASVTCTGNRVEWNGRGGFVLPKGDSFNFTGNFFDRSFGPALELGSAPGTVNLVTATGNIFRRSGAYEDRPHADPERSCHMLLTGCTGSVFTGNTMKVGNGDGGYGPVSPDFGMIIRDCATCIIKDNVLANGSLRQNIRLSGDLSTCIIGENIGGEFQE